MPQPAGFFGPAPHCWRPMRRDGAVLRQAGIIFRASAPMRRRRQRSPPPPSGEGRPKSTPWADPPWNVNRLTFAMPASVNRLAARDGIAWAKPLLRESLSQTSINTHSTRGPAGIRLSILIDGLSPSPQSSPIKGDETVKSSKKGGGAVAGAASGGETIGGWGEPL